ncbi:MAG: class I SAM-dependent methyltransferase [Syntrophorhabdaceae bacterium]|nr:class I SAM-dependent methyltransferase [Syntrophorhabdaceae bacterium]
MDDIYMNELEKYFLQNKGRLIHKWMHYFPIYERHFRPYRNREIHVLEIGVYQGGSLQMWKEYFGEKANIYGVDINPACKSLEEERIKIFIGSQDDREFLRSLKREIPRCDILIDDGGHTMEQQIITFEELYEHVSIDGIYLCEDTHTSYWKSHGGGLRKKGTFIEYMKNKIDELHAWHSEDTKRLCVNGFTESTFAIHFYDSIVVIEKGTIRKPHHMMTGEASLLPFKDSKRRKKRGVFSHLIDRFKS